MKSAFFSIIITAYNSEKYIRQCISSVLNQNYGDLELIIVDDCSNDNTLEIVKSFVDKRIKILPLRENLGAANARNVALKECTGKYIFFLDSDDYIENNLLDMAKENLLKTKADVLFCPYYVFWENKNRFKFSNPKYRLAELKKLPCPFDKNIAKGLLYETNYELCTKFYKRDFLVQNNIVFKNLSFAEDLPFYWEVLKNACSFSYLKEQLYCYRKGHKKLNIYNVVTYLPQALEYSMEHATDVKDIFYKKSAQMLNFWLVKTNFDEQLYKFAINFCPNNGILNINSKILQLKYKISLKLFGKI